MISEFDKSMRVIALERRYRKLKVNINKNKGTYNFNITIGKEKFENMRMSEMIDLLKLKAKGK